MTARSNSVPSLDFEGYGSIENLVEGGSNMHNNPTDFTDPLDEILMTVKSIYNGKSKTSAAQFHTIFNNINEMKSRIINFLLPLATSKPEIPQNTNSAQTVPVMTSKPVQSHINNVSIQSYADALKGRSHKPSVILKSVSENIYA